MIILPIVYIGASLVLAVPLEGNLERNASRSLAVLALLRAGALLAVSSVALSIAFARYPEHVAVPLQNLCVYTALVLAFGRFVGMLASYVVVLLGVATLYALSPTGRSPFAPMWQQITESTNATAVVASTMAIFAIATFALPANRAIEW